MTYYTTNAQIEAVLDMTLATDSNPSSTRIGTLQGMADSLINAEMKAGGSNITDTTGYLALVECSIIYKMVLSQYHLKYPDEYGPVDWELTPNEKRLIHMAYNKWSSKTFEVGG